MMTLHCSETVSTDIVTYTSPFLNFIEKNYLKDVYCMPYLMRVVYDMFS